MVSLLLLPQLQAQEAPADGVYAITPERRALLNTIRFAEGTWANGSVDGYRILYGGGRFDDLSRHPEITVRRRYVSAAAGAYQFLPTTWREASARLGLRDFGVASQDQAALYLVERRGVLASVDRGAVDGPALARLAPEWASLPTPSGASHYGQPVKRQQDLLRFYRQQLSVLKG
ncbi:MAG: glycoside hydrolase family 104 protein [Cyanobacteriota bacterium]|nr:glycoside hydrolase family 104 protein [Cyanobacteriota bacterium]